MNKSLFSKQCCMEYFTLSHGSWKRKPFIVFIICWFHLGSQNLWNWQTSVRPSRVWLCLVGQFKTFWWKSCPNWWFLGVSTQSAELPGRGIIIIFLYLCQYVLLDKNDSFPSHITRWNFGSWALSPHRSVVQCGHSWGFHSVSPCSWFQINK